MSRCFNWFPISGLGKPKLYQNMWCLTRMWGFYLEGVCLCEELVGEVNHTTESVTDLTEELYFCSISFIINLNYLFF